MSARLFFIWFLFFSSFETYDIILNILIFCFNFRIHSIVFPCILVLIKGHVPYLVRVNDETMLSWKQNTFYTRLLWNLSLTVLNWTLYINKYMIFFRYKTLYSEKAAWFVKCAMLWPVPGVKWGIMVISN